MKDELKFNPYDGPTPIFSIFQWSFGGYLGPCLVIYENGLEVRAVYENPEEFFSFPKIMSTVISPDELNLLKEEISTKIDEKLSQERIMYFLAPGWRDVGDVDIICNTSSLKKIRIQGCNIVNETISYHEKSKYNCGIPDKIPKAIKKCLKYLLEYKFSDLKEYVPFYFKFEIGLKNKEGETVEWPEDLPKLDTFQVHEYSGNVTFYIDGKYYKRVLEFCEKNRHKNIKFRGVSREIYYNPKIIYPHEDLFNYNQ